MLARLATLIALSLTLGLIACGGGDSSGDHPSFDGADPDDVAVIDDWAKALSDGDTKAAADYFAIPSTAENGPLLVKISDSAKAKLFNESLPCGAELTEAVTEGQFTTATFKLTDRPGGDCGDGTGGLAKTSFVIEDGKITEWRRVGDQPATQPDPGQIT